MSSDELQQVIDDLDRARNFFPDSGEWREGVSMRRSLQIASRILVGFPDEALTAYGEPAAPTLKAAARGEAGR